MLEDGDSGTHRHEAGPGFGKTATTSSTTTATNNNNNHDETGTGAGAGAGNLEPLACVACRSRKLRCDRTKPACARCVKLKASCVYPESRRKPALKRRNVRELEERLGMYIPCSCCCDPTWLSSYTILTSPLTRPFPHSSGRSLAQGCHYCWPDERCEWW